LEEGNRLYELKRYKEALESYNQSIRLDPNNANAYNGRGVCLSSLNKKQEAIESYIEAIRLKPDLTIAINNLKELLNEK